MVAVFVVLTFALFLLIDYFVLKAQRKEHPAFVTYQVFDKGSFLLPDGFLLSSGHTWVKLLKDGLAVIGIDEFVLKAFKNITLKSVLPEGSFIKKGEILLEGVVGNNKIHFRSPIDGEIKFVSKNIEKLNVDDPYNTEYGITVVPKDFSQNSTALKSGKNGLNWLKEEFSRLKDFLTLHTSDPEVAGLTMADGGNIVEGVLSNFDEKTVNEFEKNFLSI